MNTFVHPKTDILFGEGAGSMEFIEKLLHPQPMNHGDIDLNCLYLPGKRLGSDKNRCSGRCPYSFVRDAQCCFYLNII